MQHLLLVEGIEEAIPNSYGEPEIPRESFSVNQVAFGSARLPIELFESRGYFPQLHRRELGNGLLVGPLEGGLALAHVLSGGRRLDLHSFIFL